MRKLTDHIVEGDNANSQLEITVLDHPGAGGACHEYVISYGPNDLAKVSFQNGPIAEVGVNGITHEALLAIIEDRLKAFQAGAFKSIHNEQALHHINMALFRLKERTRERIARGVEGTHKQ